MKNRATPGRLRRIWPLLTVAVPLVVVSVWLLADYMAAPRLGGASSSALGDASLGAATPELAAGNPGNDLTKPFSVKGQPSEAVAPVRSLEAAQKLIDRLARLDLSSGALTREDARQINKAFGDLIAQGPVALPAIGAFLDQNSDLNFTELSGGDAVEHRTLRLGLLDALKQIDGPEAVEVTLKTLQTTADPLEIAVLSRDLEQRSPGQYRQESLQAAHESLAQALDGKLGDRDVAPLFQVLQSYGDAQTVADLEKALPYWSYYASLTLANLPDGQGIPSLIAQLHDPAGMASGQRDIALQVLAQVSADYPQASEALLSMASANQINDATWAAVALGLGGHAFEVGQPLSNLGRSYFPGLGLDAQHFQDTGETLFTTPVTASWLEENIDARMALIDRLLEKTSNPNAIAALQGARTSLATKAQTLSDFH